MVEWLLVPYDLCVVPCLAAFGAFCYKAVLHFVESHVCACGDDPEISVLQSVSLMIHLLIYKCLAILCATRMKST